LELARAVKIPVIASGGVSSIADIERLCAVESEGVEAAILGRSLYEGAIDFRLAQSRADELSGG
jgi:phosphoribosylformimino-5-aminoimidazole carboxamide ribotide isomerase